MENVVPKLSNEQYEKNFAELKPPFSPSAALAEANRCLYCYDAPCTKACPTHIDVPAFIKKISTGNLRGSAKTILESNWVALTCAKACPVEVLCEGACVFNAKGESPIQIGKLQRHAMDAYFAGGAPKLFAQKPAAGKRVAVIGSGPAGLACAGELSLFGIEATIFEAKDTPGGLDTWGVAPYKVRREDSLKEVEMVLKYGAQLKTGIRIGEHITMKQLYADYDAVFLGIGLGESFDLKIEGEGLPGVYGALEFIEKVKSEDWQSVPVGKRVAVIGAGNTSIDAATEAKRLGADSVMILYRRGEAQMPAYMFEFELAKKEGVSFRFLTLPLRVLGEKFVTGIECVSVELGKPGWHGRASLQPVSGTEAVIPVDMVIKAVGQQSNTTLLQGIEGVRIEGGKVQVNPETCQTGNDKVFAGGDCINGGKEVVNAAADGKKAAHGIAAYLAAKKKQVNIEGNING